MSARITKNELIAINARLSAEIAALRAELSCNLNAYRCELFDVGRLLLPRYGMTAELSKTAEVIGWRWHPTQGVALVCEETAAAIYSVDELDGLLALARREQGRLVDHVGQVRAREGHRRAHTGNAVGGDLQIARQNLRVGKHLALLQTLGHGAARQFQHGHNLCALGGAQALHAFQVVRRGVQQAGYASKTALALVAIAQAAMVFELQQFVGHLQNPLARDAGAQQDGQQLGIAERTRAARQQLFARLGFQGQVFERHGGCLASGAG